MCRVKRYVGTFSRVSLYITLLYMHILRSVQRSVLVREHTKQTEQTRDKMYVQHFTYPILVKNEI